MIQQINPRLIGKLPNGTQVSMEFPAGRAFDVLIWLQGKCGGGSDATWPAVLEVQTRQKAQKAQGAKKP